MTPLLPCPTCSSTGTDTHEDRHTETRMDTCRTCGGKRFIPARTGETPEASFQPGGAPMTQRAAETGLRAALERVRHLKRGTEYEVLHRGVKLQVAVHRRLLHDWALALVEGDELVIYQAADGSLWAREEAEFGDGRFETITPTPAPLHVPAQGDR